MSALRRTLALAAQPAGRCSMTPEPVPETATTAVEAVIDDVHGAASQTGGKRYSAHVAPHGVFVGTDATERWAGTRLRANAEPHGSYGQGWTSCPVRMVHVRLGPEHRSAWFGERLVNTSYEETCGCGVPRRVGEGWKMGQYVLRFAIPNDVEQDVVERIRAHARRDDDGACDPQARSIRTSSRPGAWHGPRPCRATIVSWARTRAARRSTQSDRGGHIASGERTLPWRRVR